MALSAPHLVTPHPGPRTREIIERLHRAEGRAGLTHGLADVPVVMERAEGSVIVDPDGNHFLDMVAGFGSLSLGHSHPRLIAAATEQLQKGQQAMSIAAVTRTRLLERLTAMLSGDYRVLFATSGSEAVETALKVMRRATGRQGVIAFAGGFHGRTMGALTYMGRLSQRQGLGTLTAGAIHLPYPHAYRSPFGTDPEEVSARTLELLDHQLGDPSSGWMEIGAVLIEPVQGNGGMMRTPHGFLRGLREICNRHGVLLIFDEVMSGFHRTGTRFAFEAEPDVLPDILVLGKSLSAGLPLSAALISARLEDANPPVTETSTYAGNLVACAMALEAIDVYEQERLSERAVELGEHLVASLRADIGEHPNVGEIRGAGLMVAVELVKDRETREPLPVARILSNEAMRRGMLLYVAGHHLSVAAFLPPLTASTQELSTASALLRETIEACLPA